MITNSVPNSYTSLQGYIDKYKIEDVPEAIVLIRNSIVHSQEDKRKKLSEICHHTKYEALQIFLWYIELAMLCILGYNDKYVNRCSSAKYAFEAEELVPWIKEGSQELKNNQGKK